MYIVVRNMEKEKLRKQILLRQKINFTLRYRYKPSFWKLNLILRLFLIKEKDYINMTYSYITLRKEIIYYYGYWKTD